jgi:beta-galactosidase
LHDGEVLAAGEVTLAMAPEGTQRLEIDLPAPGRPGEAG